MAIRVFILENVNDISDDRINDSCNYIKRISVRTNKKSQNNNYRLLQLPQRQTLQQLMMMIGAFPKKQPIYSQKMFSDKFIKNSNSSNMQEILKTRKHIFETCIPTIIKYTITNATTFTSSNENNKKNSYSKEYDDWKNIYYTYRQQMHNKNIWMIVIDAEQNGDLMKNAIYQSQLLQKLINQQQQQQPNTNKSEYAFNINSLNIGNNSNSIKKQPQQVELNIDSMMILFHESDEQSGIVIDASMLIKKEMSNCNGITNEANELLPLQLLQQRKAMPWPIMPSLHVPKMLFVLGNDQKDVDYDLDSTKISHISDENIKTVNKKCDLIDYLTTKIIIKVNSKSSVKDQNDAKTYNYDNNDQNNCNDIMYKNFNKDLTTNGNNKRSYQHATLQVTANSTKYITFDELCKMQQNEKRLLKKLAQEAGTNNMIRLRLRGGGEGSLTNPNTGWGSPPNPQVGSNPNAGSWGTVNPTSQWGQPGGNPGQPRQPPNSGQQAVDVVNKNPNAVPNQGQGGQPSLVTAGGQSGNSNAPNPNQSQQGGNQPQGNSQQGAGNNPNQQMQCNNGNFPPIGSGAAGNSNNNSGGNANNPGGTNAGQPPSGTTATAKNQLEQLNTMREALFSQDGWGCGNVNQDTNWDVPGSPEPGMKGDPSGGPPPWKSTMNNGTELWEANLKCGGQPPPAPVSKAQWTPRVPIGGTWGNDEEEDASANTVWNTNPPNPTTPGWNQPAGPVGASNAWPANTAPAPKVENEWNANPNNTWGDLRQQNTGDPRNILANPLRDNTLGNPTGITGRVNPNIDGWAGAQMQSKGHMMGPGGTAPPNGQWPVTGPKDMTVNKPTGWAPEGTSPPRGRPPMTDYNDGTSLWQNQSRIPNAGGHWNDIPDGTRPNLPRPGVLPGSNPATQIQQRLGGPGGPLKDASMWAGRSWEEPPHTPGWEDNKIQAGTAWNDANSWNKQKQGWPEGLDIAPDWPHGQKPPNKIISSEIVRNSKQFRTLVEIGYKKEDAELALRATKSLEEAIDLLTQRGAVTNLSDQWRRHDEHPSGFDHPPRFPGAPTPTMPFPPNSNPNIGANPINKMNQMPPNYVPPGTGPGGVFNQQPGSTSGANPQAGSSQPSTQQLRMLVQQIQMAVQAGYLNHQILNQPLAPQTLILLNQLLTCIKQLQVYQANLGRPGVNAVPTNIITSKLQLQIKSLQSQITAQQQIYIKQAPSNTPNPNEYLRSPTDPANSLMSAFPDLNLGSKDPSGFNPSISRLESQWKVGSKDNSDPTDFSRAPGTTTKPSLTTSGSGIGLGSDGPWSSNVSGRDGWPDTPSEPKEGDWPSQASPAFTELVVPEFKPGEPWKGTQQKSIEDDPSITPGSVARSPLQITAKDTDLFSGASKTSPSDIQPISLSNSTWSFNPSGQQNFSSSKSNANNTWSDSTPIPKSMPSSTAELWSGSKAPRGPPPGLGSSNKSGSGNGGVSSGINWMGLTGGRNTSAGSGNWQPNNTTIAWYSPWLLLKNLTAQIDGSTLRTLCMQHGPLQNFHLYLTHGIALCKYSSREEAQKAQTALNNCVLGNTTICAESPSESEVQSILQHLVNTSGQGGNGNGNSGVGAASASGQSSWRPQSQQGPNRSTASDAWGSSWQTGSSTGNLWTPIDGIAGERGTPSNLSTFLPENLLGGELN